MALMAFGPYRFELQTAAFDSLKHKASWRWPEVGVVQRPVALQYIGPGAETLSLSGVIFPHFAGGASQVKAMQATAGKPQILIDGQGWIWGGYVLVSLQESRSVFFSNGAARKQSFDLELKRYRR